jgi:hypothetical protein
MRVDMGILIMLTSMAGPLTFAIISPQFNRSVANQLFCSAIQRAADNYLTFSMAVRLWPEHS